MLQEQLEKRPWNLAVGNSPLEEFKCLSHWFIDQTRVSAMRPRDFEMVDCRSHKPEALMRRICLKASSDITLIVCCILMIRYSDFYSNVSLRLPKPSRKMLEAKVRDISEGIP
jgi:hypothetical protein